MPRPPSTRMKSPERMWRVEPDTAVTAGTDGRASFPRLPVSAGNPLTAPVDYLGAAGKAKRAAEKTVDTVGLNQAIQLFQAQEGRLPKTLDELVSKRYVSSIPAPPAGMKYDYNPQTGQLRVVAAQ